MIYVGIDDTDTPDTPGTNQLARALVARLSPVYALVRITRHQLFFDPRVPYTSKNGSASILLQPRGPNRLESLVTALRTEMRARFREGSDPGLCATEIVPQPVRAFGRRCQRELISQAEARALAADWGIALEGLGGTEDGVIGALAAVGLAVDSDDGRVVQLGAWPDDLSGVQDVAAIRTRGIEVFRTDTGAEVRYGRVDVGKHLRPNCRHGRIILYVEPAAATSSAPADWVAIRLP
jgi:hypothetical protein